MNKNNIYWIGGSPCSGKSTIAEMLVEEFGFDYYKCDDHLQRYMDIGVEGNNVLIKNIKSKTLDEIWLRPTKVQVEEEFEFYRYALNIIEEEVNSVNGNSIIVEGAAILPEFIRKRNIQGNRYICIVPTKKFQVEKYSKREWVKHYLKSSSNPEKAFLNWMERDAIFAERVKQKAEEYGMNYILVDASLSIEKQYKIVKEKFELV